MRRLLHSTLPSVVPTAKWELLTVLRRLPSAASPTLPMEAILYNPCSIAKCWRPLNILETLTADIVMLTGLRYRRKTTTKLPYETVRVGRYVGYIWWYSDGALTNKAAGVGSFMTRRIRMDHVVEISSPEK